LFEPRPRLSGRGTASTWCWNDRRRDRVATGRTAICIGKPEPFLFEEVLRRAGERDRVVVIGDSTDYDMVAAHRVGARGVLILTGLTEASAVEQAHGEAAPDRVIRSLQELFALPELAGV